MRICFLNKGGRHSIYEKACNENIITPMMIRNIKAIKFAQFQLSVYYSLFNSIFVVYGDMWIDVECLVKINKKRY